MSLRQRVRLAPGGVVRLSFTTGMASSRETALALAQRYHDPTASARTFALAFANARSRLHHLGISSEEALLFERLASRVLHTDGSLRARPETLARSTLGQEGLCRTGLDPAHACGQARPPHAPARRLAPARAALSPGERA